MMFGRGTFDNDVAQLSANDPYVTILNLSGERIHAAGAARLSEALRSNTTLRWLDLRDANVGDDGASSLASVLGGIDHSESLALRSLNLEGNQIGDVGAAALAEALKVNTRLVELNLGGNCIGNGGAAAIIAALEATQPPTPPLSSPRNLRVDNIINKHNIADNDGVTNHDKNGEVVGDNGGDDEGSDNHDAGDQATVEAKTIRAAPQSAPPPPPLSALRMIRLNGNDDIDAPLRHHIQKLLRARRPPASKPSSTARRPRSKSANPNARGYAKPTTAATRRKAISRGQSLKAVSMELPLSPANKDAATTLQTALSSSSLSRQHQDDKKELQQLRFQRSQFESDRSSDKLAFERVLHATKDELTRQLSEVRQMLATTSRALRSASDENSLLLSQLSELAAKVEDANEEKTRAIKKAEVRAETAVRTETERVVAELKAAHLKVLLESESAVQEKRAENESLRRDAKAAVSKIAALEKESSDLATTLEGAEAGRLETEKVVAELKVAHVEALSKSESALQEKHVENESLRKDAGVALSKIAELERESTDLTTKLDQAETVRLEAEKIMTELRAAHLVALSKSESALQEKHSENESLQTIALDASAKISALEAQNNDLSTKLDEAEEEATMVEERYKEIMTEVRTAIEAKHKENADLKKDVEALKNEIASVERERDNLTAKVEETLVRSEEALEEAQSRHDEAQAAASSALDEQSQQIASLVRDVKAVRAEADAFENERRDWMERLSALEAKEAEAVREIERMGGVIAEAVEVAEEKDVQISLLRRDVEAGTALAESTARERDGLSTRLEEAHEKIAETAGALDESCKRVVEMEGRVAEMEGANAKLTTELEEVVQRESEASRRVEELGKEVQQLEERCAEERRGYELAAEEKEASMTAMRAAFEVERTASEEKFTKTNEELQRFIAENAIYKWELEAAKAELGATVAARSKLEATLGQKDEELRQREEDLSKTTSALAEKVATISTLTSNLANAKLRLDLTLKENADIASQLDDTSRTLEETKRGMSAANERVFDLNTIIAELRCTNSRVAEERDSERERASEVGMRLKELQGRKRLSVATAATVDAVAAMPSPSSYGEDSDNQLKMAQRQAKDARAEVDRIASENVALKDKVSMLSDELEFFEAEKRMKNLEGVVVVQEVEMAVADEKQEDERNTLASSWSLVQDEDEETIKADNVNTDNKTESGSQDESNLSSPPVIVQEKDGSSANNNGDETELDIALSLMQAVKTQSEAISETSEKASVIKEKEWEIADLTKAVETATTDDEKESMRAKLELREKEKNAFEAELTRSRSAMREKEGEIASLMEAVQMKQSEEEDDENGNGDNHTNNEVLPQDRSPAVQSDEKKSEVESGSV